MNFFRVPLNLIVVAILLWVGTEIFLAVCCSLYFVVAVLLWFSTEIFLSVCHILYFGPMLGLPV